MLTPPCVGEGRDPPLLLMTFPQGKPLRRLKLDLPDDGLQLIGACPELLHLVLRQLIEDLTPVPPRVNFFSIFSVLKVIFIHTAQPIRGADCHRRAVRRKGN